MNESGNKFALSTSDLAEMLRIGSASMSIAGNDLEQTSALMISAFEILQVILNNKQRYSMLRTFRNECRT